MRQVGLAIVLPIAFTVASCISDGSGLLPNGGKVQGSAPSRTEAPGGPGATGDPNVSGQIPRESPSASLATATPAPSGSPAASTEPTPAPTAYVPFSTRVTGLPSTASINLPAPDPADDAGYPTSVLLKAEVRFSTVPVSTSSEVVWTSDHPEIAQVGASGLVTAASTTGETVYGPSPGMDGLPALAGSS